MKITDFTMKKEFFISCEIIPPKKGYSIDRIFKTIEKLENIGVKFVSVTKHQSQIKYFEHNNEISKMYVTKNPGTLGLAAVIKNRFNIEPIPHIICGGIDKFAIEDLLIDLNYIGIENIFAIRGDPVNNLKTFIPEKYGYRYAYQLVNHISRLNNGIYLDDERVYNENTDKIYDERNKNSNSNKNEKLKTNFCIGVAGYPEKHYESLNPYDDMQNLKNKINKGADFIITQIFYSASVYKNFVRRLRRDGIDIPVIPGIKPVLKYKNLRKLVSGFNITIPQKLVRLLEHAQSFREEKLIVLKYMEKMLEELIDFGIPGIHFFTMGNIDSISELIEITALRGVV